MLEAPRATVREEVVGGGGGGDDDDDDDGGCGGGGGGGGGASVARRKNTFREATSRLASRVPAEDIRCRCRPLCSFRAPYGANFAPRGTRPIDDGEKEEKRSVFKTETRVRGERSALSLCAAFYGEPRRTSVEEDVSWFCAKRNPYASGSETVRSRTRRNGRRRNGAGARCPVWFVVARQFRRTQVPNLRKAHRFIVSCHPRIPQESGE